VIAVLVSLLAGCGDDEGSPGARSPSGATELRLELDADGPGPEVSRAQPLVCGGEAEVPTCARVDELPADPAAPVPPDAACTEIYGGPDTFRVQGTLDGESIDATFTRQNGCEIERFDAWLPILRELFPSYRPGASLAPS